MAGTSGSPPIRGNGLVFNFDPSNPKSHESGSSIIGSRSNLRSSKISSRTLDNGITYGKKNRGDYLQVNGVTDTTSYLDIPWNYHPTASHGYTIETVYENLNEQSLVYPFATGMGHGGGRWYNNGGWVTYNIGYNSQYNEWQVTYGGFALCVADPLVPGDGTLRGGTSYRSGINSVTQSDTSGQNAIKYGLKYMCVSFQDQGDNTVNARTKFAMLEPESTEGAYYNIDIESTIDYTGYNWDAYNIASPLIRFGVDYPSIYSGHHRNSRWYSIRVYENMLTTSEMENNLNSFKQRFV